MRACDVLIVGGGPAGSSCAWALRQAGLDVTVIDKATFPRDKPCAGWITPRVIDDLQLDVQDYRQRLTFQPITGFHVGLVGRDAAVAIEYARPVSYGIRRCEFDQYLLRRSGACLMLGQAASTIRSSGSTWVINETVTAPVLVGAGGHFCPVNRLLNGPGGTAPVVIAREAEFPIDGPGECESAVRPEMPELYFCPDLAGYGWCFRKQGFINVGFGRVDGRALPRATAAFVDFLKAIRRLPRTLACSWRGHAYRLACSSPRRVVDDGLLLIGDSAGLAYPQSGEGIAPAIESGLLAAAAIVACKGRYTSDRLDAYSRRIRSRFGAGSFGGWLAGMVPRGLSRRVGARALGNRWFVRHVVLDRWFLRDSHLTTHNSRLIGGRDEGLVD